RRTAAARRTPSPGAAAARDRARHPPVAGPQPRGGFHARAHHPPAPAQGARAALPDRRGSRRGPPRMSRVQEVTAEARHAGTRLDLVLGEALGLSRAQLKRLFDAGAVRVNGRVAKKGLTLTGRETLRVELPDEAPAVVVE